MSNPLLCCAKSLASQLEELERTGRKGQLAAARCREILGKIRKEGLTGRFLASKRTKRGEARVAKCVKYDLGHGYRLITILCKDRLFIPFAGSHDQADLWLEHHRLSDTWTKKQLYSIERIHLPRNRGSTLGNASPPMPPADEYEESLRSRVDDITLREIFRGLVERS